MSPLKEAVLHHKHDDISSIVGSLSAQALDPTTGAEMYKLAVSMGNVATIARVVRVFPTVASKAELAAVLKKYLVNCSQNYFGGGSPTGAASRAWKQAILGKAEPFSRDEPDFVLNAEQRKDLRFLVEQAGLQSEEELVHFAQSA